ncbi:FAD binding domain-containing protein [Pochonia chlamydosporia 170]|uniref:FAD binding domain-containing protein n=1 Tax=Pochonia chlamydosporia 170 TaxID=1380566 RepID=A0A179FML6_METCM|nr:FAD binding domain-containing protein [Pochonia chlamydosporia 170]OAQ66836.2 FAD binding domain-containing protein [Pochonia chlamydosporia 170]
MYFWFLILSLATASCVPDKSCKAHPSHQGWPSPDIWRSLNTTLGGQLIKPVAPGAVCHPEQPTYNKNECAKTQVAWNTTDYHCSNPVSVLFDQFTNFTCLPDPRYACTPDGYPAYVINATATRHIKIGIDFARRNNVRLVVKATGHDYLGRSIAPGSLSIWTHNLKNVTYHSHEFRLAGSHRVIHGNAITFGAGIQMQEAYAAADKHGQVIVGGQGSTVGIVGYITGGGHSPLGPMYGLAADNVLEMLVVTPGGKVITVNEDQHADLFWAMRGGGGSTFGVIVSVTVKSYPSPRVTSAKWAAFTDPKNDSTKYSLMSYISSKIPQLMDSGLSGYTFLSSNMPLPIPLPEMPSEVAGAFGTAILQDVSDPDAMSKLFKPINDTIQEKWPGKVQFITMINNYTSFFAWYKDNHDAGRGGRNTFVASRLLERDILEKHNHNFTAALKRAFEANTRFDIFMVGGRGVKDAQPRGGENAVNPAWRKATVLAMTSTEFGPFNVTAEQSAIKILDDAFEPMRLLSPKSGSYLNEAFLFEKNWQKSFWGANYARLLSIKRAVDPTDVFWCAPCVGSEHWREQRDGRLCKITDK